MSRPAGRGSDGSGWGAARRVAVAALLLCLSVALWLSAADGKSRPQHRPCLFRHTHHRREHRVARCPPASAKPADPSGEPMPVGDIPGWHQVFADNFANDNVPLGSFSGCSWPSGAAIPQINCAGLASSPSVEKKWVAYPDGWPDHASGTYYPSKVISILNGVMNLHLHTETIGGHTYHMVAAPLPKIPGGPSGLGGLLYGRYAIRFRADSLPGYKTAWLLWPDSGIWPHDGEIDFPEGGLDGTVTAFMHWKDATSGSEQSAFPTSVTYGSWHTAVTEWSPSACSFYLDGVLVGRTSERIPDIPMHWVIQTQTQTDGTVPADATEGNVQIDWATAYAKA